MTPEAPHCLIKNRRTHLGDQSFRIKQAWERTAAMTSNAEGSWFLKRKSCQPDAMFSKVDKMGKKQRDNCELSNVETKQHMTETQ